MISSTGIGGASGVVPQDARDFALGRSGDGPCLGSCALRVGVQQRNEQQNAAPKIAFQFIGFGTLLWMRWWRPRQPAPNGNLSRVAPPWRWPARYAAAGLFHRQHSVPHLVFSRLPPAWSGGNHNFNSAEKFFFSIVRRPSSTPAQGRSGLACAPPVD